MKPRKRHEIDDSREPMVGNDPDTLPQTSVVKKMVAPDRDQVERPRVKPTPIEQSRSEKS